MDGAGEGVGVQVGGQTQTSPAPAITVITTITPEAGEDKVEEEVSWI